MSNETISFPRELSDDLAEFIAEKARVCGGGAHDIWEALCERFGRPAEQHQGEPLDWIVVSPEGMEPVKGLAYSLENAGRYADAGWQVTPVYTRPGVQPVGVPALLAEIERLSDARDQIATNYNTVSFTASKRLEELETLRTDCQALIAENTRVKARLCMCRDCSGQGEIYSGHSSYQGHNQPPEPDMDVCGTCDGDGVLGPLEDFEALAAERDQLKAENEALRKDRDSLLEAGGHLL